MCYVRVCSKLVWDQVVVSYFLLWCLREMCGFMVDISTTWKELQEFFRKSIAEETILSICYEIESQPELTEDRHFIAAVILFCVISRNKKRFSG